MAKHAVLSGLLAGGCRVIDIGVCATPTATLMIEHLRADGGIMVTASHNPIEWNALKFFRADGMYLNAEESRDLMNLYYSGQFTSAGWDELKAVQRREDAEDLHVQKVLTILDRDLIRSKNFKIALDCCNGAGSGISQKLLNALGCEVVKIHCTPDGYFPHKPEPVTANLKDLCKFVKESGADVGFATDPDADRVAIVDETGTSIGEETGLALCTRFVLSQAKGTKRPVVLNMSTSRMTEDVALEAGCEVVRTPAGEVNVAEKMKELGAIFGGEGNGGIIDPRIHCGRDSIIGMGLALEAMARSGLSMGTLVSTLPQYHMVKTKIECPPALGRTRVRALRAQAEGARVDTRDGLRLDWPDAWVQLRASNTEPILRIIAEARTEQRAKELVEEYTTRICAKEGVLQTVP